MTVRATKHAPAPCSAAASASVQAAIEAMLPPRGSLSSMHQLGDAQARYGTAGTPADQHRESPLVEISLLLAEAMRCGRR